MSKAPTKGGDKQSYTDKVAEKIIAALEDGTAPWIRPWTGAELSAIMPINPITNKPYKGINFVNLSMEQVSNGYGDPRWLTYKQAAGIGAQVRQGEKGTTIQYWKFSEEVDKLDENGRKIFGEDGKPEKTTIQLENPKAFYSTVFNATQIDNMPERVFDARPERVFEAIEAAERIIENSGANIRHIEGSGAFYRPRTDDITLPVKSQFNKEMGYYSTALHELGHWTGHPSRLDRDLSHSFGTQGYAKEELRAEISSYMLCSELGVDFDPSNHHAYIKSWVSNLREAPNEIFKAAADAGKITQFLQGFNMEMKKEKTTALAQELENSVFPDFQALKEYTKELNIQYPNFVATQAVSMMNSSLYSNYMMANEDFSEIKYLHITHDGHQEWENISPDVAKQRLEKAYFPHLVKEWGLDKVQALTEELEQKIPLEVFAEKTFLSVAYSEKDFAKQHGAKWDKDEKLWYAPAGTARDKLEKFMPEGKETKALADSMAPMDQNDVLAQFKQALEDRGLIIDGDPIMDGKMHRVPVEGDKHPERKNGGAYIGYTDGRPAGFIQNFVADTKDKWVAQGEWQSLTQEQVEAQRAKMAQNKADRENERKEKYEIVSVKVRTDFKEAREATNDHPYLVEKGVEAHGLKLDARGNLFMPLQDVDGKIWSAQHIGINGYKGLEPDGKKEGNFFVIGEAPATSEVLIICEGYATGASIHEATGNGVIVAVDAGNLEKVAVALKEKFPEKEILIAADNDLKREHEGKDNVGRIKANAAAIAVKGAILSPILTTTEIAAGKSDFNDIHKSRGIEELRNQLDFMISPHLERIKNTPNKDLGKHAEKTRQFDLDR